MMNLDLVITSDTAVAHLAGALGCPVWVALRAVPDWRFMLERRDSPWYPTMRLFRQTTRDAWGPVFAAMRDALMTTIDDRGNLMAGSNRAEEFVRNCSTKSPSWRSNGDWLRAPSAVANAERELAALGPALASLKPAPAGLAALRTDLTEVNQRLWEIEDQIREKDAQGDFGAEFVTLARSVYRENDERGRIKRAINTLLQSTLMEEKQYSAY